MKLAKDTFGRLDAIFLNAGLMPNSPLSALKTDDWHQMVDVNITGVLNGVAAVLPSFIAQKSGHVIANSSVAGLKAYPGGAVYGGTKWFVHDFMEVLRMESAQEGTNIRTTTIYPAAINTELLATIPDAGMAAGMQKISYDRTVSPPLAGAGQAPPARPRRVDDELQHAGRQRLQWVRRSQLGSGPLQLLQLRNFTLPQEIFSVDAEMAARALAGKDELPGA